MSNVTRKKSFFSKKKKFKSAACCLNLIQHKQKAQFIRFLFVLNWRWRTEQPNVIRWLQIKLQFWFLDCEPDVPILSGKRVTSVMFNNYGNLKEMLLHSYLWQWNANIHPERCTNIFKPWIAQDKPVTQTLVYTGSLKCVNEQQMCSIWNQK